MEFVFPEYTTPGADEKYENPIVTNSLRNQLIAISRALARAKINWTPEERKLFAMILTKIIWSKGNNSNIIELDKVEIIECLGLKLDSDHRSTYLRRAFKKLATDSEVSWTDPRDKEVWVDDPIIHKRFSRRGKIYVEINKEFMPHLENLVQDNSFITMFSDDIYGFHSRFTFALFDELRLHYDSRVMRNIRDYSTKQLKSIFRLKKNDYCRKDGSFNRTMFEKKTLDVAIKEINESKMMSILPFVHRDGREPTYYEKVKQNGKVVAYRFQYYVRTKVDTAL